MKFLLKVTFVAMLFLTMSCHTDNLLNDAKMVPSDSTKTLFNSKLSISYNKEKQMFIARGNSADFKDFIYSEDTELKNRLFIDAYNKGFEPLTVYGEIPSELFDEYSDRFEDSKEKKSLEIMSDLSYISEEEIEEEGIDIDNRTFIQDNDFASVLNYNGQIQFNDSIYTYTPKGLFIVNENKINHLTEFLNRNSQIEIVEGFNRIDNNIASFKPLSSDLQFKIPEEDYSFAPIAIHSNSNDNFGFPSNTNNFSNCSNLKRPWFPNLFGRSYTCVHKLSSTNRIKTVFRVQNFLIFNNTVLKTTHQREKVQYLKIKIWPFKIKWKLFKYWENASADKLYTKINLAYFEVKRSNHSIAINDTQMKAILKKISDFVATDKFSSKPYAIYMMNDEYALNNIGTYNQKHYNISHNDIDNHNNYSTSILYPNNYDNIANVNLGNLNPLSNSKKKILLNLFVFNNNIKLSTDDLLKQASKVFSDYTSKGYNKDDIGVIMNEINLKNVTSNQMEVTSTKVFLSGESLTAQHTHKVQKTLI